MESFSPEFSAYWLREAAEVGVRPRVDAGLRGDEGLSESQEAALQELAERVNAARSVV